MNTFGTSFRVSIFGESHGEEIGAVIDGVPAGIYLDESDFDEDIARRSPRGEAGTPRHEKDIPHLVSGVWQGHTTGAPIAVLFRNTDTRPEDYAQFAATPRPGHGDYAAAHKWAGLNDPRGGGHLSGRLTLPIVAAGVIAKKALAERAFRSANPRPPVFDAHLVEVGGCGNLQKWPEMVRKAREDGDSLGGVVECVVYDLPVGLGEPFWDSVESLIAHAMFAIPGVRGVEFGDGFKAARMTGWDHNDPLGQDGPLKNGAGGANAGLTNGAPLHFRVAFKPSSSIAKAQRTWNFEKEEEDTLCITGRHDCCFAMRTPVIVEAMAAIVLADLSER